jgi:hypothetical protein
MVNLLDPIIYLLFFSMVILARGLRPLVTTPKKVYLCFNQGCKLDRRKIDTVVHPFDGFNRRKGQQRVFFGYQPKHWYFVCFGLFLFIFIIVNAFNFKIPFNLNRFHRDQLL